MARKIIQISNVDNDGYALRALADDGTIWDVNWSKQTSGKYEWVWELIPNMPQDNVEAQKPAHNNASMAIFSELSKRVSSLENYVNKQKSLHSIRG